MPNAKEVTTSEAAALLGVGRSHVRHLIGKDRGDGAEGKELVAEKRGRDWLVAVASIEDYQRRRRTAGRPPDTLSGEPARNRGGHGTEAAEVQRVYQREHKRRKRAAVDD